MTVDCRVLPFFRCPVFIYFLLSVGLLATNAGEVVDGTTQSCVIFRRYTCGDNGFVECRDPLSGNTDTFVTAEPDGCSTGVASFLGDG